MTSTQFCASEGSSSADIPGLKSAPVTANLCDASKTWPYCWGASIASLLSNSLNAVLTRNSISIGLQPSDQSFCIKALVIMLQKSISCNATDFISQGLSVGIANAVATEICGQNQTQTTSIQPCFEVNFNLLNGNNGFKMNSSQGDIILLGAIANVNGAPVLTTEDMVTTPLTSRTFVISNLSAINAPTFDLARLATNNQYGFSISVNLPGAAAASVGFQLGSKEGILFGVVSEKLSFNSFGFINPQGLSGNIQATSIGSEGFYINVEGGTTQIDQAGAIFWIPNTNSSIKVILDTESLSGTFVANLTMPQNDPWYNIFHSNATCNSTPCQFNSNFKYSNIGYDTITVVPINGTEWIVVQMPTQDVGSIKMAGAVYVLHLMTEKQIDLNYLQLGQDPSGFKVVTNDPNCYKLCYQASLACSNTDIVLIFECNSNIYFFPYPQTISQSSVDLSLLETELRGFKENGINFLSKVSIMNEETVIAQNASSSEIYVIRSPCS